MGNLLIVIQGEHCISLDALIGKKTVVKVVAACAYHLHGRVERYQHGEERLGEGKRREEKWGRKRDRQRIGKIKRVCYCALNRE